MSRAVVVLATIGLMLGDQLHGQGRTRTATTGQRSTAVVHVLQNVGDLTFAVLDRAMSESRYEIVQVRRVRDGSQEGRWIGLVEGIHHDIDANGDPRYRLEFLGLEGQNLTNDQLDQRRAEYEGRAGFIYLFQSFRVHDLRQAEANYRIYPVATTQRLDRPVLQVVIYPLRWDRSIWILDVDTETGYPLYCAEYNSRAQLLSELIVREFNPGKAVVTEATRWKPTMTVVQYDSTQAARQVLGSRCQHMIEADVGDLPPGYKRSITQIVDDPATGDMNYVNFFTDGIDNIFLVQTSGTSNPLKLLGVGVDGANTVLEYHDLNVAQYVFYHEDVRFMIVGRSALQGLRSAVESMYRLAIR